ncbi:hypothetical protein N0V90_000595 [Kalmusia sp. IMI 367209]|nr:hypothetical protein N0V90_000595 [Kalmusia sp. IMI 367209]
MAKPIESKEDFEAAISGTTKYVSIYVHEGPIPEEVRERFKENAPKFAETFENYKLDIATDPAEAKEKMQLEKVPTLLIYKDGKEVKRVAEPDEEKMKVLVGELGL